MIQVRLATEKECNEIRLREEFSHVSVESGRTFVAFDSDNPSVLVGALPVELCWRVEPLVLLNSDITKTSLSRACILLYLAAEDFIKSTPPDLPKWLFVSTRSRAVKAWSSRLGWARIYSGAAVFIKYLAGTTSNDKFKPR